MDVWEALGLALVSVVVFVVLHAAIFLLVRWMYPPTVMPAPMVLPAAAAAPAPPPAVPATPAEPPLPDYYTQPTKKENAETSSVTLPMAPASQEGATNIADLQGRSPI